MTKQERLKYMKERFTQLEDVPEAVVIPPKKEDIDEEIHRMDTFIEYEREAKPNILTSDEL